MFQLGYSEGKAIRMHTKTSGEFHAPVALPRRKERAAPSGQEVGKTPDLSCPDHSAAQSVA